MKKLRTVITTIVLLFAVSAGINAQLIVEVGAATQLIMEKTKLDQAVHYVQMIEQQIEAVKNTYNQLEAMVRAEQRAIENLKGIQNVDSYSDFMNWYNGQLYLEQRAEDVYMDLGVEIGGKPYKLGEIDKIPGAAKDTYGSKYWNEFTPEQRRQMWLNAGLTPSNYIYQSTWKEKEEELGRQIMAKRQIRAEENEEAYERHGKILEETKKEDIGEKGLLQALIDIMIDTNHVMRNGNEDAADEREREVAQDKLNNTPASPPGISASWNNELFGSITDEQGVFVD